MSDPVQSLRTRAVLMCFFAALSNADGAELRDLLALDASWWVNGRLPTSGSWRGPDGILDVFLAGMFDTLAPRSVTTQVVHRLLVEGVTGAAEWTTYATTRAGEPYQQDYVALFVVRDQRIAEVREYFDTEYTRRLMFPDSA